jgi:hypothetical protein
MRNYVRGAVTRVIYRKSLSGDYSSMLTSGATREADESRCGYRGFAVRSISRLVDSGNTRYRRENARAGILEELGTPGRSARTLAVSWLFRKRYIRERAHVGDGFRELPVYICENARVGKTEDPGMPGYAHEYVVLEG